MASMGVSRWSGKPIFFEIHPFERKITLITLENNGQNIAWNIQFVTIEKIQTFVKTLLLDHFAKCEVRPEKVIPEIECHPPTYCIWITITIYSDNAARAFQPPPGFSLSGYNSERNQFVLCSQAYPQRPTEEMYAGTVNELMENPYVLKIQPSVRLIDEPKQQGEIKFTFKTAQEAEIFSVYLVPIFFEYFQSQKAEKIVTVLGPKQVSSPCLSMCQSLDSLISHTYGTVGHALLANNNPDFPGYAPHQYDQPSVEQFQVMREINYEPADSIV